MKPARPRVVLVGGSDVHLRLPLMQRLGGDFEMAALGTSARLAPAFAEAGFEYGVYRLGEEGRADPLDQARAFFDLVRAFRARRPQVVHAFDARPGVWGCLAARASGVPVCVGTVNGLGFLYQSSRPALRLAWKVYQGLQGLACRVSDATVFQNREDAHQLVADGVTPAAKARIVFGSGVASEDFAPERVPAAEREALRQELGIDKGDLLVTMISRVIRSKGVLEFAAAARRVQAARPGVRFLLVGPVERSSLDRLDEAELRELGESLVWPGARRDVPAVLAASDLLCLPTAYREGLPRVLLEGGAVGLPLVATDAPGCRDVIEHGVNGLLVRIGDAEGLAEAVLRLVDDPELRRRLGDAARRRVRERFDLSVVAAATGELYRELLARKGVPS